MNDAERLRHIEDFGAMSDRAVAAEKERDALQAELEEAQGLVDPAMWIVKNYEEWLDVPNNGDAFGTLMAAVAELRTYLAKKGA